VDWPVRVEGTNGGGHDFEQAGVLQNISSGGAMLHLKKSVPVGMRLDVYIRLPLKGKKWMKYSAHIIRTEGADANFLAAVKFEGARPEFAAS
jgi:hypothetical protein